ncbi:MAG: ABC transporter ATP-binding protein [Opitutales bacterium]|nr:ABC transporter ATP-binding protein [Opitutales bacterium]
MDEVINLQNLCVRRADATILDGVNWRVRRGENWVLMGANGSGKTSLLSVLAGYLTPSEGRVGVCGKVYGEFPWQELRSMLGLVSSSVKRMIQPCFTALEITASGKGAIVNPWETPAPEELRRAERLLRDAGLDALAGRAWELLSQGERQRVLICRALMAEPKLMILDEPCTGLDPVARLRFLDFVEQTATRSDGPPMVFVTHHVEEIVPSFTHILVLKNGKVLACGEIGQLMSAELMSEAFGAKLGLDKDAAGRWQLKVM